MGGEIIRYACYKNGLLKSVTDFNGNVTLYDYNSSGQPVTTERPDRITEECIYDENGRLAEKEDYKESAGTDISETKSAETPEYTEEYITESHSSEYSRILEVKRYAKEETETGAIKEKAETTKYVYGNGLISQTDTNGYRYYHYNHLGSTTKLTDMDGNVTDNYTYGTYGELLGGDTEHTRFLYNGRYGVTTDENGLYYMRARYYNTDIRSFINQDIITGSIGNSQSLNRYAYVQGNPVSYTDPFGLSPLNISMSGLGHSVLDFVGMLPVIGAPANLINCYWYCKEGKYGMAAMSAIAILPGVGQFVGAKLNAIKLTRAAQYIITATKFVGSAATCFIAVGSCIEAGINIYHDIKHGKFGLNANTIGNIATIGL